MDLNKGDLAEWRKTQEASDVFKNAIAHTFAALQIEIAAQHTASVRHLQDEIQQLRATVASYAHMAGGDGSGNLGKALPFPMPDQNDYPKDKLVPCRSSAVEASAKAEVPGQLHCKLEQPEVTGTLPCKLEHHPGQPVTAPSVPPLVVPPTPPDTDPKELKAPPIAPLLADKSCSKIGLEGNLASWSLEFVSPSASWPTETTALEPTPEEDQSASRIKRWEDLVAAYVFGDTLEDRSESAEDLSVVVIHQVWLSKRCQSGIHQIRAPGPANSTHSTELSSLIRTGDHVLSNSFLQHFVLEPCSDKRTGWVLLGAFLICYDLIVIPLGPFVTEQSPTMDLFASVTLGYWALDVPLNFCVGFLDEGLVEMRPGKVALRYIKSWFALDVALVAFDVLLLVVDPSSGVESTTGVFRSAKTARLLRLVRGVRLLRLVKLSQSFSYLVDKIQSQYTVLSLKLCLHLFIILGINHYVACGWYFLGRELASSGPRDGSPNKQSWLVAVDIVDAEPYFQYLMSLHWSVTQFTPATNNISPTCASERAYAIMVVLFALVTFSSFVSSVTNTVNEMRRINMERTNEVSKVREFISKRKLSKHLSMRIWHFFRRNYTRRKRVVVEEDIVFFREVPQSLMAHVHEEMYLPVLKAHGALGRLRSLDLVMASNICHTCFCDSYEVANQDLFLRFTECHHVRFIRGGRLIYYRPVDKNQATCPIIPKSSTLSDMSRDMSSMSANSSGRRSFLNINLRISKSAKSGPRSGLNRSSTTRRQLQQIETEVVDVNMVVRRSHTKVSWNCLRKASQYKEFASASETGRWVSDAALWLQWRHWGQLSTETHVEMVVLDTTKFHKLFSTCVGGPLFHALKGVAVFFAEYAEAQWSLGNAVTDISVQQVVLGTLAQRSLAFQKQRGLMRGSGRANGSIAIF